MTKGRLEAFSDGVLAIIITIMVLELAPPQGSRIEDLFPLWPKFLSYVLSFAYIGIYWNNHHHLLQASRTISARVLWANMHLLFWLSLVPFATAWMGENSFAAVPVATYGALLVMPSVAFFILLRAFIAAAGQSTTLAESIGNDLKGKGSIVAYVVSVPIALVAPLVAVAMFILVAAVWIIPDPRFERSIRAEPGS